MTTPRPRTCVDAAAEAMAASQDRPRDLHDTLYASAALDAIDPRLKLLTPEDTTAILDWMRKFGAFWLRGADGYSVLPAHVWEVLL